MRFVSMINTIRRYLNGLGGSRVRADKAMREIEKIITNHGGVPESWIVKGDWNNETN